MRTRADHGFCRICVATLYTPLSTPQMCAERRLHTVCGSPQYMAPEISSTGDGYRGPPVDMWALGALVYELLHAQPAFAVGHRAADRRLRGQSGAGPRHGGRALRPRLVAAPSPAFRLRLSEITREFAPPGLRLEAATQRQMVLNASGLRTEDGWNEAHCAVLEKALDEKYPLVK